MATYSNSLRLTLLSTGEGSGTWGNTTNDNLTFIASSFGFGTEAITTNADTHTTTIADGSADPGRSIFLKYTGTLDSACTITIGPNTVSKLWFIENATSGSQSIIIKQGSGATVTIPNGQTKAIYSDGAGSGGAMVDAFQDLSIPDLFVDDDLTVGDDLILSSDSAIIKFGADADTTLTHTDGSGLTLNSTNKIMFNDASQFIQGSSATVLSLGATDEIDLTATAIDVNGTIDVSGNATLGGTLGVTGAVTADAGISIDNITIDGTEIDLSSGDLTIDVAGDIILDANGADVLLKDDGTQFGEFTNSSSDFVIKSSVSDKDMLFKGNDGGSEITALTLDMSAAGAATFNDKITAVGTSVFTNLDISGDVDIDGTTNLDVVDIDGAVDMASTLAVGGVVTANAGVVVDNITIDGTEIDLSSGDLTVDVAGDIKLDAGGSDIRLEVAGTQFGKFTRDSGDFVISSSENDKDIKFAGADGGADITALTLDMSAAGEATFNAGIKLGDGHAATFGAGGDLLVFHSSNENIIQTNTSDQDLLFKGNDGGSTITALTLDMSAAGAATFNAGITTGNNGNINFPTASSGNANISFDGSNFNITSNSSSANMNFQTSSTTRMTLGVGGDLTTFPLAGQNAIFNEDSVDADFRIESDSNSHMLFVDGGNDRVLIKTSSAINSSTLSVAGTIAFDGQSAGTFNDASGFLDFNSASDVNIMRLHSGGDAGESSQIEISTVVSGSQSDAISVESGGTIVINQDSAASRDFRVESDNNNSAFVIDASDDEIELNANTFSGAQFTLGSSSFFLNVTNGYRFNDQANSVNLCIIGNSGEMSVNEGSQDYDFRVESNNLANMLLVDGGNDRVFIGSTSTNISKFQSSQLAIGGNSAFRVFNISGTSANDTGISVNAGNVGMAMLVIGSRNTGSGTATASAMYLLNFSFNGNNTPTSTLIAGTDFLSFGQSAGNDLTITNAGSGNCTTFLMMFG
tara:strand:- start:708 stop:3638 length:2931 start_codon:yes stop_codon:yes gene_type:complete